MTAKPRQPNSQPSSPTTLAGPFINGLGLIAGSRSLPLILAHQARKMGVPKIVAVAFANETDPSLASLVDEIVWLKVGQLVKLIEAFKSRQITRCVMAGQIAPQHLFSLRPDFRALSLLVRLKEKNAHTLFGAIAEELRKDGVELIEATPWLKPLMPAPGFSLGTPPSPAQQQDLAFGFKIAKEMSRLEIGQTVVVKNGAVLAVEAFEGTDASLRRGGTLAGKNGGAIAVKVAKQNHDMRFDIPCIGPQTVEVCIQAGIAALGIEAEKTLILEQPQVAHLAQKKSISIVALAP